MRVTAPRRVPPDDVRVAVNGADVTGDFTLTGRGLDGVVRGLPTGESTVTARARGRSTSLRLTNHPVTGPMRTH